MAPPFDAFEFAVFFDVIHAYRAVAFGQELEVCTTGVLDVDAAVCVRGDLPDNHVALRESAEGDIRITSSAGLGWVLAWPVSLWLRSISVRRPTSTVVQVFQALYVPTSPSRTIRPSVRNSSQMEVCPLSNTSVFSPLRYSPQHQVWTPWPTDFSVRLPMVRSVAVFGSAGQGAGSVSAPCKS